MGGQGDTVDTQVSSPQTALGSHPSSLLFGCVALGKSLICVCFPWLKERVMTVLTS